jgi:hypothetical protein
MEQVVRYTMVYFIGLCSFPKESTFSYSMVMGLIKLRELRISDFVTVMSAGAKALKKERKKYSPPKVSNPITSIAASKINSLVFILFFISAFVALLCTPILHWQCVGIHCLCRQEPLLGKNTKAHFFLTLHGITRILRFN